MRLGISAAHKAVDKWFDRLTTSGKGNDFKMTTVRPEPVEGWFFRLFGSEDRPMTVLQQVELGSEYLQENEDVICQKIAARKKELGG
ncbi:MAG: hypothetical protein WCZ86_14620, partial [Desulfurivibrionaceae bacterium]